MADMERTDDTPAVVVNNRTLTRSYSNKPLVSEGRGGLGEVRGVHKVMVIGEGLA